MVLKKGRSLQVSTGVFQKSVAKLVGNYFRVDALSRFVKIGLLGVIFINERSPLDLKSG